MNVLKSGYANVEACECTGTPTCALTNTPDSGILLP